MAGFVLDLGLETFEVQDSEGNVRGTICFNPSDPGLAGRWDAVQKRLAERPEGLQGMEDIAQLDAELKAGIDQAFGSPVSGVLFGPVSSLAICADGEMVIEKIVDALTPVVLGAMKKAAEQREKKLGKYTAGFEGTEAGLAPGQQA